METRGLYFTTDTPLIETARFNRKQSRQTIENKQTMNKKIITEKCKVRRQESVKMHRSYNTMWAARTHGFLVEVATKSELRGRCYRSVAQWLQEPAQIVEIDLP